MAKQSDPLFNPSINKNVDELSRMANRDEKIKDKENSDIRSANRVGEVFEKLPDDEFDHADTPSNRPDALPHTMADEEVSTEIGTNYGLKTPPQ